MKKYLLLFSVVAGFLGVSCEKPADFIETVTDSAPKTYTVTIGFNSPVQLQTKSGKSYDKVNRLDVYYYGINGEFYGHESFCGEDVLSQQVSVTMEERNYVRFLFLANLPEDLATYIGRITKLDITTHIYFPFEEQESLDYPIMGATQLVKFTSDQSVKVDLYRYTYNLDIGRITAGFTVESMKNKEIAVKRIILINTSNQYDLVHNLSSDMPESIYGKLQTFDYEILGGGNTGYAVGPTIMRQEEFIMTYEGLRDDWSGEYSCSLNDNYFNFYSGEVRITDRDIVKEATIITLDKNNIIGLSDDNTLNTVLEVNKTLTGLAAEYLPHLPINGGRNNQDNVLKLVIEVEIDGKIMFYPIHLMTPQPNTIYHIENIILKGVPSDHCNYYPVTYDVCAGMGLVTSASEVTVGDMGLGANPTTGELLN